MIHGTIQMICHRDVIAGANIIECLCIRLEIARKRICQARNGNALHANEASCTHWVLVHKLCDSEIAALAPSLGVVPGHWKMCTS